MPSRTSKMNKDPLSEGRRAVAESLKNPSSIDKIVVSSNSNNSNPVSKLLTLARKFNIPIETIDEQYTSLEAKEILKKERQLGLRGKIKKETIDATAATLIAKRWLNKTVKIIN
mgnify:CR=1 FL=1